MADRSPESSDNRVDNPANSPAHTSPRSHDGLIGKAPWLYERPWQDYAFAALLAVLIIITYGLLAPLQQLPSPLYGGDVYYHFGVINHIYTGNAPWTHNHFLGEYAHYPWISHLLAALIGWVTGAQIMTVAIYFPILTTALAAIIAYLLGITIFRNRSIALLYALFWATFQVPHTAASPFAELVVFPLFLLLFARASDTPSSRIWAGVGLGLTGLAQVVTWIGGIMTVALVFAWRIVEAHASFDGGRLSIKPRGIHRTIWKQILFFLPIGAVALPIALLFWGPPLFVYHGFTPNNWSEYVSLGPKLTAAIAIDTMRIWFFNTDTWLTFILAIGSLLGMILAIRSPRRFTIPLVVGAVAIIGILHPFIKEVGIGFYPFGYIFDAARGLLFFTAAYVIYKSVKGWGRASLYAAIAIFLIINAQATFTGFANDRWVQTGKTPNPQYEMAQWIMKNTPLDAVFLTPHEETGFALNAMTGRKVLIARRTHASPFVDVNQRAADAAIILYGTNATLSKDLVRRYNLKYIYEDFYSIQNQGQCLQYFDKLSDPAAADASLACLRTDPPRENYINAAGITGIKTRARLDPASNVAPLFDMIAIKPGPYGSWLTNHSRIIKAAEPGGQIYQRLTEINP